MTFIHTKNHAASYTLKGDMADFLDADEKTKNMLSGSIPNYPLLSSLQQNN
jgi:hypothetical protein